MARERGEYHCIPSKEVNKFDKEPWTAQSGSSNELLCPFYRKISRTYPLKLRQPFYLRIKMTWVFQELNGSSRIWEWQNLTLSKWRKKTRQGGSRIPALYLTMTRVIGCCWIYQCVATLFMKHSGEAGVSASCFLWLSSESTLTKIY